jgi:hypothetical protein
MNTSIIKKNVCYKLQNFESINIHYIFNIYIFILLFLKYSKSINNFIISLRFLIIIKFNSKTFIIHSTNPNGLSNFTLLDKHKIFII